MTKSKTLFGQHAWSCSQLIHNVVIYIQNAGEQNLRITCKLSVSGETFTREATIELSFYAKIDTLP